MTAATITANATTTIAVTVIANDKAIATATTIAKATTFLIFLLLYFFFTILSLLFAPSYRFLLNLTYWLHKGHPISVAFKKPLTHFDCTLVYREQAMSHNGLLPILQPQMNTVRLHCPKASGSAH